MIDPIAFIGVTVMALGAAISAWGYGLQSREALLVGLAVTIFGSLVCFAVFVGWLMEKRDD